jgi:hypothetical protein
VDDRNFSDLKVPSLCHLVLLSEVPHKEGRTLAGMLRVVSWIGTDVSEEPAASIIMILCLCDKPMATRKTVTLIIIAVKTSNLIG